MRQRIIFTIIATLVAVGSTTAQVFSNDEWQQKNLFAAKMSQLYYELKVGINVRPQHTTADFVYMAFGYGTPTRKNAWRKFMPENIIPDGLPKALQTKLAKSDTDDLHAAHVSVGWQHWFNHVVGLYAQAGWGFIADLSDGSDLTAQEKALLAEKKERTTFIYNTVPIQAGLSLCLWQHYTLQAGVSYLWKEIPLLTVGVGYAF